MTKQELYETITQLFNQFTVGHNSTTKKGAADARKALSAIKKLITPYNKTSVEEGKVGKSQPSGSSTQSETQSNIPDAFNPQQIWNDVRS